MTRAHAPAYNSQLPMMREAPRRNAVEKSMIYLDAPSKNPSSHALASRPADEPEQDRINRAKISRDARIKSLAHEFISFLTDNPTVFHAVQTFETQLESCGFQRLSSRESWTEKLEKGGKYYVERNGSALVAFAVGRNYKPGNGAGMIAGHIDALTAKLKPISKLPTKAGFIQLGVAPYAGGLGNTWWDRDLGIAGRVVTKDFQTGKIETKLVTLPWPIAKIPTLAPHFGAVANGPFNQETEMVPIIGLDNTDLAGSQKSDPIPDSQLGTFTATQPQGLVKAITRQLKIEDHSIIMNWELELYDTQPAQLIGLDKEFISAGRIDDKLCSFAAIQALLSSVSEPAHDDSSILKVVGLFDDEEIGSGLRQGAKGNLLPNTIERICEAFDQEYGVNRKAQTYANSFLVSADVNHAVNPNFLHVYLANHAPRLNVGVAVAADSNGHMTTDAVSASLLQNVADKCGSQLQVFQIRNDSRSGGTVGPMLSSVMGCRAIDAGIPQLAMHSIRATTGSRDPGLGVQLFKGFFDHFEEIDAEYK